jgi:RNA polymerase sigma factor (TIGR02999 family)
MTDSDLLSPHAASDETLTVLLHRYTAGEPVAMAQLAPRVYAELRRTARHHLRRERPDHTLQPTALVNEVFLRLAEARDLQLNDRAHFFRLAAQIMRHVLIDYARVGRAQKRGGDVAFTRLHETLAGSTPSGFGAEAPDAEASERLELDFVALEAALEKLRQLSPRQAQIMDLRYFAGLPIEEVAALMQLSPATVKRDWTMARVFLRDELEAARVEPPI